MNNQIRIALFFIPLILSCSQETVRYSLPYDDLQEGDLAFRCGQGVVSRVVTIAEEAGVYSHVGVLVNDNGKWKVVHAVPGEREVKDDFDRVKMEDIEMFFSNNKAVAGCLVHTGINEHNMIESLRNNAKEAAKDSVRFDNQYSLEDSNKVYCTEFVWRLYLNLGIDLSEGRRKYIKALHINGDVILPEHLLEYSCNSSYFSY